ncbi:hypothetical protein VTK73DRAFT_9660 [Phialemonium thermophilum]|uniref:Letm1 RBD domain-containing protein n=1 Tax=Phialemonium thermophilum TaxID=223376 RepID=A0ABR3XJ45_9PEZI
MRSSASYRGLHARLLNKPGPLRHAVLLVPLSPATSGLRPVRILHDGSPRLSSAAQQHPQSNLRKPVPERDVHARDTPPLYQVFPAAANPPPSTRPPALTLPERGPDTSTFTHLYATAKAYVAFYKTGLRNIYTNTRLLWPSAAAGPSSDGADSPPSPPPTSRAYLQLRARWRHDAIRLPLFAVMLLVCGELTPLVVLAVPRVAPLTCRIPRQDARIRRDAQERRRRAIAQLHQEEGSLSSSSLSPQPAAHYVARALGAVSPLWDSLAGGWVPAPLARARADRWLSFLTEDSALLLRAGGAAALEADEVRLACAERGIETLGKEDDELRTLLARWLALTAAPELDSAESKRRMAVLAVTQQERWPESWPQNW